MLDATTDLKTLLNDPNLLATSAYLAGEWTEGTGGRKFEVTNPARGDVICEVADIDRTQTAAAIDKAYSAQKDWAARTAKERANILREWFDLMVEHADDLATILTAEQGKPACRSQGEKSSMVPLSSSGSPRKPSASTAKPSRAIMADKRITVLKQPIGVAAAITPWNFPNAMITRKAGPALAAGCAFVVRPASLTPLSALALGELADRAGLPKGILSIIPSNAASEIGKEFTSNPKVRKTYLHRLDRGWAHPASHRPPIR